MRHASVDAETGGGVAGSTRAGSGNWHLQDDFIDAVERARPDQNRGNANKHWREAWVIAQFVLRVGVTDARIRLTPDSSPSGDAQIEVSGQVRNYEIAEAMDGAMPPALEKLHEQGESVYVEPDAVDSGAVAVAKIPALITQKSAKNYPAGTNLIVYVNLWLYEEQKAGLVPAIALPFETIWLLTSASVLRIHPA